MHRYYLKSQGFTIGSLPDLVEALHRELFRAGCGSERSQTVKFETSPS